MPSPPVTALFAALLLPAVASAADDPLCDEQSTILELDARTGDVYRVVADGRYVPVEDGEMELVYDASWVVVEVGASEGEWTIEVTPAGGRPSTWVTRGGVADVWLSEESEDHTLHLDVAVPPSGPWETPVVPDIIIKPKPNCPPSP